MGPAATAVIFKINYFGSIISYWYYLTIVLSFSYPSLVLLLRLLQVLMYSLLDVVLSPSLASMGYFVSMWKLYLITFSCSWSTAELQV